jgi:hypothetical protein
MDGNWRKQTEILITKAMQYVTLLRMSHAYRDLTWYAFYTSFMKSLEYPMEAASLSKDQWNDVMKPLVGTVLQRCGIASTSPRDLLFTSLQYQGLGARHPYYQQEIKHLSVLITETANPESPTGQLLVGEAEDLRLELGLQGEFTDAPWDRLGAAVTHTWLTHFLRFAAAHAISIHDPLPKLLPRREHDRCLMHELLKEEHSTEDLRMLISWRQYFDVTFLSEISNAAGTHLLKTVWDGTLPHCTADRTTRARPPPHRSLNLALWRRALGPFTLSSLNRQLRQPLGLWVSPPPRGWKFLYSPSEDRVYEQAGLIWKSYTRTSRRINRRLNHGTFQPHHHRSWAIPPDLCRADIRRNRLSVTIVTYGKHQPPFSLIPPSSLDAAIMGMPPSHSWTIGTVFQSDNGRAVAEAIQQSTCLCVSDGSFKHMRSTFGFLLEGPAGEPGRIYGTSAVPGARQDQDSYRGKLGGIMGVLHVAACVAQVHGVTSGKLRLGLDGLGAMEQARLVRPVRPSDRSFNLLAEIRATCKRLPFQVKFFWIEGHQTERHGREDYAGYLNRLCDNLAKAYWNETEARPEPENIRVNYTT